MLSATHRALLDALRTATVWLVMAAAYYATLGPMPAAGHRPYGEPLNWLSTIEAFGFCCMVLGTLVHNDVSGLGVRIVTMAGLGSGEVEWCKSSKDRYKII